MMIAAFAPTVLALLASIHRTILCSTNNCSGISDAVIVIILPRFKVNSSLCSGIITGIVSYKYTLIDFKRKK